MKKQIAIFICIVMVLLTVIFPSADVQASTWWVWQDCYWQNRAKNGELDAKPVWTVGDVNYDRAINAVDALMVLQYSVQQAAQRSSGYLQVFEFYMMRHFESGNYGCSLSHNTSVKNFTSYPPLWSWNPKRIACTDNSVFLSDVTGDCTVDAVDALAILQYAVGKRTTFDRTDFAGNAMFQLLPWPDDWRPGMCYDLTTVRLSGDWAPYAENYYAKVLAPYAADNQLPWDFYDPANWTYLPGYYEEYILPLKEANGG